MKNVTELSLKPVLNLVVIRVADVKRSRQFYETLGLQFFGGTTRDRTGTSRR